MRLAVFAFTRRGCGVARRAADALAERAEACRLFTMAKFGETGFEAIRPPLSGFTGPIFDWADAMVFVGSCGVAVRSIAPYIRDKRTDPAVLVVDDGGSFVISLLSGHIGGANRLARVLARELEGQAVITTATDVNGRFSVDSWATSKGMAIGSMWAAKAVSAAILEGDVPLWTEFPVTTELPAGVVPGQSGPVGIYIGYRKEKPFDTTLQLIPRILRLGLGCRRGISADTIETAVSRVLEEHQIPREALRSAASIDLKANEEGLLEFCRRWELPVTFHTAEELGAVRGEFTPSAFVKSVTGVDNVCERAALLGAEKMIVQKTACGGVTVALAEEKLEVSF